MTATERCDCGGSVPVESGPVHPYMRSAPACWRMYTTLIGGWVRSPIAFSHVDCFAVQHPGGADTDRRQRQSVAVHLVALCLRERHGVQGRRLAALRGRTSEVVLHHLRLTDWPLLAPPDQLGSVTVVDIAGAASEQQRDRVAQWPRLAWDAWREHHDTVAGWAHLLIGAAR